MADSTHEALVNDIASEGVSMLIGGLDTGTVSYTHLTLPTIYSV